MQNAPREYTTILTTFIKLKLVFKTFVLSTFEWSLKTGFTLFIFIYREMCLHIKNWWGSTIYYYVDDDFLIDEINYSDEED